MAIPVKPPAAERLRPTPWDALIAALVLGAAVLLALSLRPAPAGPLTAVITLDGQIVAQYELDRLTEPAALPVGGPYPLVVEAEPGRIRIAESACPGGDCLRSGWADRAGDRIICLPNRLVISLTGGEEAVPEFDAVSG